MHWNRERRVSGHTFPRIAINLIPGKKTLSYLIMLFMSTVGYSQLVSNPMELEDALITAVPGTIITLADGTWNDIFIAIEKSGTSDAPIVVTAQNAGAVLMTGNTRVYMKGAYLTVSGLVFQEPANLLVSGDDIKPVFELKECDYCRILNNKIDAYNGAESQKEMTFKWILTDGQHNEIAYNSFIGKYGVGSIINDNRNSAEPDYLSIHHNYFANRVPINEVNEDNDQDAIRIGNSGTSLSSSFTEVYSNYFFNFFGEIEVISNKSGDNKYYNNTFRTYSGALTLRHGNQCEVYGNYFFADDNLFSGGVRVIGEGHKIYNNYIEGINSTKLDGSTSNATGGINVSNGRLNSALNGYYQVKNTEIINNTFVNCDYALRIGTKVKSDLELAPEDLIVANNIMYNTSENAYQTITTPTGSSLSSGNMLELTEDALTYDGDFYRISEGSTPIGAGVGNYAYLNADILGGIRNMNFDAGAEELGSNGEHFPYNESDVGVTVGFGAISEPTLSTAPLSLIFDVNGGTMELDIVSNVDWSILEDIPWLSIDASTGSGSRTVNVTAEKNQSGVERSGTFTIDEIGGGSNLSTDVSILQLNTFLPMEIPIIGSISLGMEDKEGIEEINAYNDDLSNYWSGNPDEEPEVSITFDLECIHELTEIGIHFWKADERTTTFSIAIADDAEGPFTTVLDGIESASNGATVETEQRFDLSDSFARFVKFIGIGNSSANNWTSIANVNIYGNISCEGTTNAIDIESTKADINLFPVPSMDGILTIKSQSKKLNKIEIFDLSGRKMMTTNGQAQREMQLDVRELNKGSYLMRIEGIGTAKFLIN
ncbi:MAG: chondroitinase-B domain-containing protein [Bacteroidota bacterium]